MTGNSRRRWLSKCRRKKPIAVTLTRMVLAHRARARAGYAASPAGRGDRHLQRDDMTGRRPQQVTAVTGADGGYQLDEDPRGARDQPALAGEGGLSPAAHGYADECRQRHDRRCRDGGVHATVHGKVCDAAGKPVPGATVVSVEGGRVRPRRHGCGGRLHADRAAGRRTAPGRRHPHRRRAGHLHGSRRRISASPARRALVAKPRDIPLALALLDADGKLPKEQRRFNRADTAAHDRRYRSRRWRSGSPMTGDEPVPEGLRAYLLARQAEKDPAKVDELLVQLNMLKNARLQALCRRRNGHRRGENRPRVGRAVISHREADL